MKFELLADIACVDNLNLNKPKRFSLYYIFSSLKGSNFIIQVDLDESESIASEQLTNYFIYRYFTTNEHSPTTWLSFAILSTQIILALSLVNKIDLCEIARMYSGEIEYDTENIERILENLYD